MMVSGMYFPKISPDFPGTPNIYFVRHLPPSEHPAFFSSSALTLNVTRSSMPAMGFCPSGRLVSPINVGWLRGSVNLWLNVPVQCGHLSCTQ
jgi:hypothetical protein